MDIRQLGVVVGQLQQAFMRMQAAVERAINGTDAEVRALTERVTKLEQSMRAMGQAVPVHAQAIRAIQLALRGHAAPQPASGPAPRARTRARAQASVPPPSEATVDAEAMPGFFSSDADAEDGP